MTVPFFMGSGHNGREPGVDEVLDALSRGLTQKILHGALAELHASEGEQRQHTAEVVSRLFLRNSPRDPAGNGH